MNFQTELAVMNVACSEPGQPENDAGRAATPPLASRAARGARPTKPTKPKYRILICDDAALIRKQMQLLLTHKSDFQVVDEAICGRDSVVKAVQLKPDLVLMDVCMPDLNGAEATRLILAAEPGIKVLAYSSDSAWETVDRMLAAGAGGYVVKGEDMSELVRAVRTLLAGGHYLSRLLFEPDEPKD